MIAVELSPWERKQIATLCKDILSDGLNLEGDGRWRALLKKIRSPEQKTIGGKSYLLYSPEFDDIGVYSKRHKSFWRDAWKDGLKGKTPLFFVAHVDVGFQ